MTVAIALGAVPIVWSFPDAFGDALRKEGLVEDLSHLVLLMAALAWLCAGLAARRPPPSPWRSGPWWMAALLLVLLLEETDWSGVYGPNSLAEAAWALFGADNLHNAWSGWSYVLFALPVTAYFALPLLRRVRPMLPQPDWGPRPDVAVAFAFVVVLDNAVSIASDDLGPVLQELFEALVYVLLLLSGWRAAGGATPRGLARRSSSPAPGG